MSKVLAAVGIAFYAVVALYGWCLATAVLGKHWCGPFLVLLLLAGCARRSPEPIASGTFAQRVLLPPRGYLVKRALCASAPVGCFAYPPGCEVTNCFCPRVCNSGEVKYPIWSRNGRGPGGCICPGGG